MTLGGGGFPSRTEAMPARTRTGEAGLNLSRDRAIADAVFTVLADVGYRGFTMDEVALAAGVSKATIYRRWSSKSELLVNCLKAAGDEALVTTDNGSLREDLLAFLRSVAVGLEGSGGQVTRSVIGELAEDPALAEAYRNGPLARWDEAVTRILERAEQRGEVDPGMSKSLAVQAGPATLLQLWFLRGYPIDDTFLKALVDEVMLPLLLRNPHIQA